MKLLYLPNAYSQQRQREKKAKIYPVLMAMEAEWYRKKGYKVLWHNYDCWQSDLAYKVNGILQRFDIIQEPEGLPFLSLPSPDRVFTRAKEYTSGNYKYLPGTHIQAANGCWHGKCTFCVENGKPYEVRPVEDVLDEIGECILQGFNEVFDDSGTFPIGKWLEDFCKGMQTTLFNKVVTLGCNMRMVDVDYAMMKRAGFRMLLFGLESANQETLDRINKGVRVEDVKYIIKAAKAGLEPHLSVMFGYPWETDRDAVNTLHLVRYLLRKGYAKTAQASLYNPGSGELGNISHRKYVKGIYKAGFYPEFWFNQIKDIRNKDDLKYLWRKIKAGLKSR